MKIAIIGSGIEVFCCAHRLLDLYPELEIHIFDEKAESGMYGEEPGIFAEWPPVPSPWFGEMFSQAPNSHSTAVRYSWFVKSLSIMLAKRGATIHLKTRVLKVENNNIHFSGAGTSGAGEINVEKIINFQRADVGKLWYGVISNYIIEDEIFGIRSDKTIEIWLNKKISTGDFIQEMEWYGENPQSALTERALAGIETAELTII